MLPRRVVDFFQRRIQLITPLVMAQLWLINPEEIVDKKAAW